MQCKDIPTIPILSFVAIHGGIGCHWWHLDGEDGKRSVVHAMPDGVPQKLVLAKMRQLIYHELIAGCPCGCRGDWELTEKGRRRLDDVRAAMTRAAEIVLREGR